MQIDLTSTTVFKRNYNADKKIVVNRGGTRSGKTVGIVQCALVFLLDPNEKGVWSICRKTLPALKATAYRDFMEVFETLPLELQDKIHQNKSELTFEMGNRMVEFFSLDDSRKVRSRKRKYLHIVEANEIDFETFSQLVLRTTRRVYLDFNPDDIDIWINEEVEVKRAALKGDVQVIVSTYEDNPFLSEEEIAEIEYLRIADPELWAIFGQGNYGKITGVIFKKYTVIPDWPVDQDYHVGLDWGFSKDPNGALRVGKTNNRLYLDELLYKGNLLNSEIATYLPKDKLIVADSAEPKSIEDIKRMGYRIVPSVKGKDSVRSGIVQVQEYELFVTARSVNLLRELNRYKRDADGEPIDAFNHLIDPLRYVVQTKFVKAMEVGQATRVNKYANAVRSGGGHGSMMR